MSGPNALNDATRLFFAVLPDAMARERLSALAVDTARRTGGRPSRPDTLHLTLVFVGTVAGARVPVAADAAASIPWRRCALVVDTLGGFLRAGVAWAGPSEVAPTLVAEQRDLVAALAQRGIATDARPWRPHVTLARACARTLAGTLDPPIRWDVDRVVLMASRLSHDGPRYREVASWPAER